MLQGMKMIAECRRAEAGFMLDLKHTTSSIRLPKNSNSVGTKFGLM
jgi:hypothetical protein